MVLGRVASNFVRAKRNAENTPPKPNLKSASSKLPHFSATATSRRRRARSNGTYDKNRPSESARRRNTRTPPVSRLDLKPLATPPPPIEDVEMREAPRAPASAPQSVVTLPRHLARPVHRDVERATLAAIEPELGGVPTQYIRDRLQSSGPALMSVLAGTSSPPITDGGLPKMMQAVVTDLSADMPTHMFAVYNRQDITGSRCQVTLYPAHHIVFAAHCANLPALPPSKPLSPETAGSSITLPVVPICIPSPPTFPLLSAYLYTKRADHLLAALMPFAPQPTSSDPEAMREALQCVAKKLAGTCTAHVLLQTASHVSGLWRNVCALGVYDEKLWATMDVAWEVMLMALAVSTRKPHAPAVERS